MNRETFNELTGLSTVDMTPQGDTSGYTIFGIEVISTEGDYIYTNVMLDAYGKDFEYNFEPDLEVFEAVSDITLDIIGYVEIHDEPQKHKQIQLRFMEVNY